MRLIFSVKGKKSSGKEIRGIKNLRIIWTMVIQNFPDYWLCRIKPNLEPHKTNQNQTVHERRENWREWHLGKIQPKDAARRCSWGLISLVGCDVGSWFDDGKNPSQVFLHLINCNAFYRLMCCVHQSEDQGELEGGRKLAVTQNLSFCFKLIRELCCTV